MKKLVVDIDDTLADISHRRKFYENKKWDEYNSLIPFDSPIVENIELVNILSNYYSLTLLTGRYERYRNITTEWLLNNNIKFDDLIMKPNNDDRSSYFFKTEWIANSVSDIAIVFDDRDDIINFCRNFKIIIIIPSII